MNNGPIEPNADTRQLANIWRQLFVALTLEGFTETQALTLIGQVIAASFSGKGGEAA